LPLARVFPLAGLAIFVGTALVLRWQTTPIVRDRWLDTDVYRFVRQAQATAEAAEKQRLR
jgi:hypothetical protein